MPFPSPRYGSPGIPLPFGNGPYGGAAPDWTRSFGMGHQPGPSSSGPAGPAQQAQLGNNAMFPGAANVARQRGWTQVGGSVLAGPGETMSMRGSSPPSTPPSTPNSTSGMAQYGGPGSFAGQQTNTAQAPSSTLRAAGEPLGLTVMPNNGGSGVPPVNLGGWAAPPGMQFQPNYQPPANPNSVDRLNMDVINMAISGAMAPLQGSGTPPSLSGQTPWNPSGGFLPIGTLGTVQPQTGPQPRLNSLVGPGDPFYNNDLPGQPIDGPGTGPYSYGGLHAPGMIPGGLGSLPGNQGTSLPGLPGMPQNQTDPFTQPPYTQDPYSQDPGLGGGIRTPTFDANTPVRPPFVNPGGDAPIRNPGTSPGQPYVNPINPIPAIGVRYPGITQPTVQTGTPGGATGGSTGTQNPVGLNTNYGASINTSIDPAGIYSPAQTQAATNQAIAHQHALADPYTQLKLTTRPGFSRSASNAALALPGIMQGRLGGAQAAFEIPFLDTQANMQHQLAGETAREGEAIDWGNILARLIEQQSRQRTSAFGPAVGLTDLLLG